MLENHTLKFSLLALKLAVLLNPKPRARQITPGAQVEAPRLEVFARNDLVAFAMTD
jgi:hypothetical protein